MPQGTRTFRLFVSSTFSDLGAERAVLHDEVFPALRDLCAAHGCRFQAIDLRWGVSQEAALDQRTMDICLREIARCQEVTPRPNFIVLLGDRYGWRPLPVEIAAPDFEAIVDSLHSARRPRRRIRALLARWYQRDDNAINPVYVLQPRVLSIPEGASGEQTQAATEDEIRRWTHDENRLRLLLRAGAARAGLEPAHPLRRFPSATEQEIYLGALEGVAASDRVFGFFRSIQGQPPAELPLKQLRTFREIDARGRRDREADVRQRWLKRNLRHKLRGTAIDARVAWTPEGITSDHFPELARECRRVLELMIRDELTRMEAGGVLEIERETHRKHGESLAADFVEAPRVGALRDVARYVSDLPGHLLVVMGAPGSGRSALLAAAIRHAIEDRPGAAIIQRFFGISPRSSDPRTLLADLCDEIGAAYGQSAALPQEFRLLAQELDRRLHFATPGQPLLLFLDALDQMSEAESAHHLAWLPARLPPHVGIVVSTLPGDCQRALERKRPAVSAIALGDLSAGDNGEAAEIFDSMMTRAGRRLRPDQRTTVLKMAAHCPRPLFLRLASAEAIRWKSYTDVGTLPDSVDGLIRRYLETLALEVNHGTTLVARSLGYLAAAKRGLTEDELLDVLSEDDEVLADFARRSRYGHALPDHRLPVVVWSRLSFDLQPYLAERRADGTNLIGFYHAQLRPIVHELFVAPREELLHKRLARGTSGISLH